MIKDNKKYNILVIEDNLGDFTLIEVYLKEEIADPTITRAESFQEASAFLSNEVNIYDVILLDLSLPDKAGEQLIKQIILLCRQCPIIILTAFADIDFSIKSLSLGIADYLLKDDISTSTLYKSILYTIERRKTNERLLESENQYINLLNLSPQPMWVYDPETYRFIKVNKAARALYGYNDEEFLSMTVMDISEKEFVPGQQSSSKRTDSESLSNGRFLHYTKSGNPIDVEVYSTPVMIDEKIYQSVLVIDVTEKILVAKEIAMAIIKTQEDERYEIGGELHDNVCQILAISQVSLSMIKDFLDPQAMEWFEKCKESITLASEEIRNLSHRLAPVFFDDINLEEAFRRLLDTINTPGNICSIFLHVDDAVNTLTLSRDIYLTLYRILQEQLGNILKYSKAKNVNIEVIFDGNNLKMTIADNGIGFDAHKTKKGIGLANMTRRAELFSGKSIVESSPGNGCKITIEIPLNING